MRDMTFEQPVQVYAERPSWPAAKRTIGWGLTIFLAIAWFMFLRPAAFGGPASFVMVSGTSMQPTMHTGDLVITHEKSSYEKGDVVAYQIPTGEIGAGNLVIHRVIGGNAIDGYVTQGDNRDTPDGWRPKSTDILGERWLLLPKAAGFVETLRTPLMLAFMIAAFSVWIVWSMDDGEPKPTEDEEDVEA